MLPFVVRFLRAETTLAAVFGIGVAVRDVRHRAVGAVGFALPDAGRLGHSRPGLGMKCSSSERSKVPPPTVGALIAIGAML